MTQLGIRLPAPPQPVASYVPYTLHAGLLFVSGQGPLDADGTMHTGLVGRDVSIEQARDHARITAINLLAQMNAASVSRPCAR